MRSVRKTAMKEKADKKKQRQDSSIICSAAISRRISFIIFENIIGFIMAMKTYRGTFLFWKDPASNLGTFYTAGQQFNGASALFFDLTMLISCVAMLQIARRFTQDIPFKHKKTKQVLSALCALGFFLVVFPYPVYMMLHRIGASFVIGGLWGLSTLFSVEVKPFISSHLFYFYQFLLQGSILTYAFLYLTGLPGDEIAQKFGITSLMIVLWFTTRSRTRDKQIVYG
ncbi:MAG TPA: hypothetical protein VK106_02895 [Balneolaceae bacterium]|nr:hypothetical protein [Balneolaceae bacterium]